MDFETSSEHLSFETLSEQPYFGTLWKQPNLELCENNKYRSRISVAAGNRRLPAAISGGKQNARPVLFYTAGPCCT